MERAFSVVKPWWRFEASYNVAPTQSVPIVRLTEGGREGVMMRWGLIPFFARGVPPKYSTINARIETVESAASYRGPWKRGQRCIQVASGFYEWHLSAEGKKQPYFIQVADQDLFGFAGLWDRSVNRWRSGRELRSYHYARQRADVRYPQHRKQSASHARHLAKRRL